MKRFIVSLLLAVSALAAGCSRPDTSTITIVVAEEAGTVERTTAEDLRDDLRRVSDREVRIDPWSGSLPAGQVIAIGTVGDNALIDRLVADGAIALTSESPGPRGGIWARAAVDGSNVAVLAGSDPQGRARYSPGAGQIVQSGDQLGLAYGKTQP